MGILEDMQAIVKAAQKPNLVYGMPIIESKVFVTRKQARKHKKKRINKKWLKRYGYIEQPDPKVYVFDGRMYTHPKIVQIIMQAIN